MNARTLACLLGQPTKEEESKKEGNESLTWQSIIICQNNCHTFAYQQPILFFLQRIPAGSGPEMQLILSRSEKKSVAFPVPSPLINPVSSHQKHHWLLRYSVTKQGQNLLGDLRRPAMILDL